MTKPPDKIAADGGPTRRPGLPWPLWIAGLIVAIGVILAIFGR